MRFTKFKLPLWVAGGLLTVSATAAEPTVPSRIDPGLYNSFAQADVPSAVAPVVPNVPTEDQYQMRALPPSEAAEEIEEGPTRYLENEFLGSRGIQTYGWINAGIGANGWGAPWNGPITFNDRAWQGMLNQLYLVNERVVDTSDGGWDLGGRVDLLYGTDFFYTVATGLDAYRGTPDPLGLGGPRWNTNQYYGLAMPQLYGELGAGDHAVKFGHFYTIIGYEVVPAVGNFFYTHAYTMQYGEPFTHTGVLDTWTPNDQLTVYGGITNGWDNWDTGLAPVVNNGYPGFNSNAALLAGVTFASSDETQALTWAITSGNQNTAIFDDSYVGNRSMYSLVYTNELTDKLTYVIQHDNGWQFNGIERTSGTPGTARWYGLNQYMFYNFTDTLIGGMRFEWFRDNNGTRVVSGLRNFVFGSEDYADGFAGNFWALTWGLNYLPTNNIVIRPELRYDWYSGQAGTTGSGDTGARPFGKNFDQTGQFYGGCDVIWQF
jgi:hypothetical protein